MRFQHNLNYFCFAVLIEVLILRFCEWKIVQNCHKPNYSSMIRIFSLCFLILLISFVVQAKDYKLSSPDGKINTTVSVDEEIKYSVQFENITIIEPSSVSFSFKQAPPLGKN